MKPQAHAAALTMMVLGLALSACQQQQQQPEQPYPPIPPPREETMAKPPVTTTPLLWQFGHWDWNGGGYVWVPGNFVPRDEHSNIFVFGTWAQNPDGSWTWQPAHWK
jgi:hypothetical protein